MSLSLTFYGGINEIGGNKILLETKEARIFFDFGEAFTLLDEYFLPESFLAPRERFGLRDYFEFGLIPKLKGLYSREAVERTDVEYAEPEFDAVFLTHAHQDHWAHLCFLHPEIPVHMGECTRKILESTWITTRQESAHKHLKLETFRTGSGKPGTGNRIRVGDVEVRPIHVDHSVPGAYGFIAETPEGAVAYTGDLRMHGPKAEMSAEFIEEARKAEPEALIIEGTRVLEEEKRKDFGEREVYEGSRKALGGERPAVVMRYPKDLDRLRTFWKVAGEVGKELVISRKTAHLLDALKGDVVGLPDPLRDERIRIYGRELKKYSKWEEKFRADGVSPDEIREKPGKFIFEADFWGLPELIDVRPEGGVLVHSMSEPFEEDPISLLGSRVLGGWVRHFGLEHLQLHASGHAPKSTIFEMVKKVGAKRVFPVHTLRSDLFEKNCRGVMRMEKGKAIKL
ncbi:MAG: MBL fold metallo-hydrolase [Candidatus Micrarchaeota archaeon]